MACRQTTAEPATIPALVADRARRYGPATAVVDGEIRYPYAQLHAESVRVTRAAMAAGIRAGDRVALWAPNTAHWIVTALGLLGAGATLVPIGTRLRGAAAAAILRRTRCRALFTVRGFLGIDYPELLAGCAELPDLRLTVVRSTAAPDALDAEPVPAGTGTPRTLAWSAFLADGRRVSPAAAESRTAAISPDAVADILFTSGTTGTPKGVLTTHRQTLTVMERWAEAVTIRHGDRYLLVNPFSHTFGYRAGIVACLLRGATMVPVDHFDANRVATLVDEQSITVLAGTPTIFTDLLATGRRLPTVRLAGTGGTAIAPELVSRIRTELGITGVFTGYGLTESVGVVAICPPHATTEQLATTVGKPLRGSEIRIVDTAGQPVAAEVAGEILVRGPNVMAGYLDDPAATAAAVDTDGWLHTGDIGVLDRAGRLRITDRLRDMFIVGGFNVYPAEVEEILRRGPGVADVAVVGVPDERLGEVGAAFVVPIDSESFDPRALLDWCREHLAGYQVPRVVRPVAALPRDASGKLRKSELRTGRGGSAPHLSRRHVPGE